MRAFLGTFTLNFNSVGQLIQSLKGYKNGVLFHHEISSASVVTVYGNLFTHWVFLRERPVHIFKNICLIYTFTMKKQITILILILILITTTIIIET